MKILLMPKNNNLQRIKEIVSKAGYDNEIVESINTIIGIQSGVLVRIEDTSEILTICSGFTEKEKTYEIGITKIL